MSNTSPNTDRIFSLKEIEARAKEDFPDTFEALPPAGHSMLRFASQKFLPPTEYPSTVLCVGWIHVGKNSMDVTAGMSFDGKVSFYINDFGIDIARSDYPAIVFNAPFGSAKREGSADIRLRAQRSLAAYLLVRHGIVSHFREIGGISISGLKVACEWFFNDQPKLSLEDCERKCCEAHPAAVAAAYIAAAKRIEGHQSTGNAATAATAQQAEAHQETTTGIAPSTEKALEAHHAPPNIAAISAAGYVEARPEYKEKTEASPGHDTEGHQAKSEEDKKIDEEEKAIRREFMDGELEDEENVGKEKTRGFARAGQRRRGTKRKHDEVIGTLMRSMRSRERK